MFCDLKVENVIYDYIFISFLIMPFILYFNYLLLTWDLVVVAKG